MWNNVKLGKLVRNACRASSDSELGRRTTPQDQSVSEKEKLSG